MPETRILVADDDPAIRMAVSWLLKEQGYEVAAAPRGEEMYDLLERKSA